MSRSSLIVGIDDYLGSELYECVNDAKSLAEILRYNQVTPSHRTRNFAPPNLFVSPKDKVDKSLLVDPNMSLTAENLMASIHKLFTSASTYLLFYFSGHSDIDFRTGSGYLKTPDRMKNGEGVAFSEVMKLANDAGKANKHCLIILDTCNSGEFGGGVSSEIASGMTIIAAARSGEAAIEQIGGGVLTQLLVAGLKGSAADIAGRITPASLYAYVDSSLGNLKQRPVYKSNVNQFMAVREVVPRVPLETLRNMHVRFKSEDSKIKLSPEYEPTPREKLPEIYKHTVPDPEKVEVYLELRALNRNGMAIPVGVENLYDAAMESKPVELTELGRFYHRLARTGSI